MTTLDWIVVAAVAAPYALAVVWLALAVAVAAIRLGLRGERPRLEQDEE